ncbi:very large A-kinase anchor protein isoform X2 [Xenopus laevis]|uniref:Very large A-kinase anchor protein isoform X2 n=1 Tax=Xenopus laevis TaxID=8355 RepID=A0A8J0UJB9_XENLA|nr:very large A-kinase anchor protein isoform X2 [Xenopus laevis]
MTARKKSTSWQEEVARGFSRFFSRSSSQELEKEADNPSGNEQEQPDSTLSRFFSRASPPDKDKKLASEKSSLEESTEGDHQSPSRFFSRASSQDKDKKLDSEKSFLEESTEGHQSPSWFFSRISSQEKDKKLANEKSSLDESAEGHQSASRFLSRVSSQDKDKKLDSEKSSLEESGEGHQSPSWFFSRVSSQDKDKKLASEKSSLEESTEGHHQNPSRFFSRASFQDKDKKSNSEKSSLDESTEGHQSPSRFFPRPLSQDKDKNLAIEKSSLDESAGRQSPSRFFSRASSQDKDKNLASEKSSLEQSTEGHHQSPSRFFFRRTTPDKETKDKSLTPEEQEKGLNLSKLFNRGTPQDSKNVSNTEERDTFSSITRHLSVTFSQDDERDTAKSKTTKINLSSQEDKNPITVRDNNENVPVREADQNISKTEEESRMDWNHDGKSPIQEKQPKEKILEFFGQFFSFSSKSPMASPKQTPGNQDHCRESQDEPFKNNLEEEFVTVEQSFQEPDGVAQATEDKPANREIDLGTSDRKQKEENSSQELKPSPTASPVQRTSNLEAPSITYGTYRGSKKIRKLLRRRADVNSPIPEKEEVTDTETIPSMLDYSTDSEITSYTDAELCGGPDEQTANLKNSSTLPSYLERNTKSEEPLQPESYSHSNKRYAVDLQGNSETVTLLHHSVREETIISIGLQTEDHEEQEDRNQGIPNRIQSFIVDSQPDITPINGNKQILKLNGTSEDESSKQNRSTINNLQGDIEDNSGYVEAPQKETNPPVELAADEKPKTITILQNDAGDISNRTDTVQPHEVKYSKKSGVSLSLADNNSNIIELSSYSSSSTGNNILVNDVDDSTKEMKFSLHEDAKLTHEMLSTPQFPGPLESDNDNNSISSDGDFEKLQHNKSITSHFVQSQTLDSLSVEKSYKTSNPPSNKHWTHVYVQESLDNVNPSGKPDINEIPHAEEVLITADNNISDDRNKQLINVPPEAATSFNLSASFSDSDLQKVYANSLSNICSLSSSSLNEGNIREADSFDEGHSPTFAIPSSSSSFVSACVDEQRKGPLPSSDSVDSGLISSACTPDEVIIYNNYKPETLALDDQGNNKIVESDKTVHNVFNLKTVEVKNTNQVDYIPTTENVRVLSESNTIQGTNVVIVNNITPKLGNNTTTEKTVPSLKERIGKLSSNQISEPNSKDVYFAKVSVKSIDVKEVRKIAPHNLQSEIITTSKLPTPTFESEYIQLSIPPPPPIDSDLQGFQQDQEKSSFKHFNPKDDTASNVQPDIEVARVLTSTSPDVTIENIKNNNITALMRASNDNFINMSSLVGTHDNEIDKILSICVSEMETKDVNLQDAQKEPKETNIYFSLQAKVNVSHEIHGKPPALPMHSTITVEKDTFQVATENSEFYDTLLKQKANEIICTVLNKAVEEIAPNNSTTGSIISLSNENSDIEAIQLNSANVEENAVLDSFNCSPAIISNEVPSDPSLESVIPIMQETLLGTQKEHSNEAETTGKIYISNNSTLDHENYQFSINEFGLDTEKIPKELGHLDDILLSHTQNYGTNVDELLTSHEALKVDHAKVDTNELSSTSENYRTNFGEINHSAKELLIQTSDEALKVDQSKEGMNELLSILRNNIPSVDEINHSTNELLTQTSGEALKVDQVKEDTSKLLSASEKDRTNFDEIEHSTKSSNELLTQKFDEALKVDQTKENTNENQNCEQGATFVVSDIIGVKHTSCDNFQNAADSGLGGVIQEKAFADESYQVTNQMYPKSNDPFVSMANEIVCDIITSATQNVTSGMLQASLNKNIDGKIQSEIEMNSASVSLTGAGSIATQNTENSKTIISLYELEKDYNITAELTNTDGEQNQDNSTLEGTVNGFDIITKVSIPTHSPHLGWSLGTDEDFDSYECMNNTDVHSGEIVGEAVHMVATDTDFLSPLQFSIHQAHVIEISENDDDQDNNEYYVCDSEETSDQDSYFVVHARRRRIYPFSLSPIYEDDSSSEDILSTSASPKNSEADHSNCSSILTLLQSVSDRLKQTNILDNEEVSHEECSSLPDMSAHSLDGHSNMDGAEKTEDVSKTQVVDQPVFSHSQIPTRSSLFITKTMPEIKSLVGTGRQSILMHLTKKSIVLNSKRSGETLSPTAVEEGLPLQKLEDSNLNTESAAIPPLVNQSAVLVEESSKPNQKFEVEVKSHLESRNVHYQSNLNSQNNARPPEPKTVNCQENIDTSKQDDSLILINPKCSVEGSLPPTLEDSSSLQKEVNSSLLNSKSKTEVVSSPSPSTSQTASESVLPIQVPEVEPKSHHTMLKKCPSPPEIKRDDFQKLEQDHSLKTQAPLMSPEQPETIRYNPRPGKVVLSDILHPENKIEVNADVTGASSWIFPNGVNIRVIRGCWILYEKPSFEGLSHVLEEGEAELSYLWEAPQSTSEPNRIIIGSIKRVVKYPIIGSSIHLRTEVPSIESLSCHIHHSLVVKSGVWLAYSQPQFNGPATVLEEGSEIPEIQEYGIRSVRPLKMGGLKVQMPSDPKIILYEKPYFEGKFREFAEHIYCIKSLFSDDDEQEIGSIRVLGGIWVGYDLERFKGRQYLLEEGEYPDWQSWGGSRSSLHSMRYLQADFMETSVTLYESDREDLKQLEAFNLGIPDVEQAGYGPETQSIHVKKGMWVAYEQKHYCGEQYILEKGRYKSCADWGGNNNTIMSIRPVLLEPHGSNEPKHLIKSYSGVNFRGECVDFTKEVSDFKSFTPSSFKVLRGCWLLCYQGDTSDNLCVLEEGHFPDMVSCGCPAAVIKFIQPIDYVFAEPSLSLFSLDSCEGRELHFEEAVNSVLSRDLHFYTQSVWVRSGLWIAYEEAHFLGRQILLEAKKILNWAEFSGWNAIGSLRPLKQPAVYLRIKNRHNNKYLTVTGNLADTRAMSVCVSPRNGPSTQIWYFCRGLLKSKASDTCLDIIGGKNIPGSKVSLWTELGKLRQKWRIHKDGTIASYISEELVLDLKGGNYYDQNHIVVNNLQPGLSTQKWDIEIL